MGSCCCSPFSSPFFRAKWLYDYGFSGIFRGNKQNWENWQQASEQASRERQVKRRTGRRERSCRQTGRWRTFKGGSRQATSGWTGAYTLGRRKAAERCKQSDRCAMRIQGRQHTSYRQLGRRAFTAGSRQATGSWTSYVTFTLCYATFCHSNNFYGTVYCT